MHPSSVEIWNPFLLKNLSNLSTPQYSQQSGSSITTRAPSLPICLNRHSKLSHAFQNSSLISSILRRGSSPLVQFRCCHALPSVHGGEYHTTPAKDRMCFFTVSSPSDELKSSFLVTHTFDVVFLACLVYVVWCIITTYLYQARFVIGIHGVDTPCWSRI
jgi:hypothetical protein